MDSDKPHLAPNEKMHPIQWTEGPTGALVAAGSLCPMYTYTLVKHHHSQLESENNYCFLFKR
jgi:hypothetical protein